MQPAQLKPTHPNPTQPPLTVEHTNNSTKHHHTQHSFLIMLRNPLKRLVSWYYYMHPDFPPAKKPHHRKTCSNFEFFRCWPKLDDFLRFGLSSDRSVASSRGDACAALARGAATGTRNCFHNYWNYERTYAPLLKSTRPQAREMFALRTEHLNSDWQQLNALLEGNATSRAVPFPGRQNSYAKPVPHSLDPASPATRNLCAVLCREIQVYKTLLAAALNLRSTDRAESLEELAGFCPVEVAASGAAACELMERIRQPVTAGR
jgi:hypothetical protein